MEKYGVKNSLFVQNLKCGGCAATIEKALNAMEGVTSVKVNQETSEVIYTSFANDSNIMVESKLASIGYPAVDSDNTTMHKINSFVSCAKGRLS